MKTVKVLLIGAVCFILNGCESEIDKSGTWEEVDEQTLRFVGTIDEHTHERFLETITPEITTLQVRTDGGEVEPGLAVGQEIHNRELDIIVDGMCSSSCANYWFPAGNKKTVPLGSWVGFHGNPRASSYYSSEDADIDVKEMIDKFTEREAAFYDLIGVRTDILYFSSEVARAFERGMYFPSPEQFECYGVSNLDVDYPEGSTDHLFLEVDSLLSSSIYDFPVTTQEVRTRPELAKGLCKT